MTGLRRAENRTTEGETTRAGGILRSKMVEVAGVEPASLVLSQAVSTCLDINLLSLPERLRSGYPVSRFSKIRRVIENQITRYTC